MRTASDYRKPFLESGADAVRDSILIGGEGRERPKAVSCWIAHAAEAVDR